MKVVKPTTFTTDMLYSSSAVEPYPVWVSGTTYHKNDIVVHVGYEGATQTYRRWQCVVNNTTTEPTATNADWADIGPCNKCAMFDNQTSTQTTATTSLVVTFKTGLCDTIGFLNAYADSVSIVVRESLGGTIMYEATQSLRGYESSSWYQYFFYDVAEQRTQAIFQVPITPSTAYTTVTFTSSGNIRVGNTVFGITAGIGSTQYGMNIGIIDYSTKDTDEFGTTTFVQRAFSKRFNANVFVENYDLNRVARTLYGIRAKPTLFIGSYDQTFEELSVVFGYYKDFTLEIQYPTASMCSLEVEGLT